jgi:sulfite dehydrogenase
LRLERRCALGAAARAAAFVSVAGFATAAALAQAPGAQADDPEKLISGPGMGLTQAKCQICHELAHTTRARLSRGEWLDNLRRMRERGAPLTDAEIEIIVNYLATYYGRDPAPPPSPDTLAAATPGALGGAPADLQSLLNANACSGCHALDKRVVGPSFREIAARYAGDSAASARLAAKVRAGGQGAWGSIPMPPAPGLSESDLARVVEWVLGQK